MPVEWRFRGPGHLKNAPSIGRDAAIGYSGDNSKCSALEKN